MYLKKKSKDEKRLTGTLERGMLHVTGGAVKAAHRVGEGGRTEELGSPPLPISLSQL